MVNPFSITSSDSIQNEACASPKLLGFIDNPSKPALQTPRHAILSRLFCRLRPFRPPLGPLFHFFSSSFTCHGLFPLPRPGYLSTTTPTAANQQPPVASHRVASSTFTHRLSSAACKLWSYRHFWPTRPVNGDYCARFAIRQPPSPPHRRHVPSLRRRRRAAAATDTIHPSRFLRVANLGPSFHHTVLAAIASQSFRRAARWICDKNNTCRSF